MIITESKDTNLDEPNSYYRVIRPFQILAMGGFGKDASHIGNIYFAKWYRTEARVGQYVMNLVGGCFLADPKTKLAIHVRIKRDRDAFNEFPMDCLEKVDKPNIKWVYS